MKVIYEPMGRAKEFSLLAANLYRGYSHVCIYCYVPPVLKMKRDVFVSEPMPRNDVLRSLEKDALAKIQTQVRQVRTHIFYFQGGHRETRPERKMDYFY